MGQKRFGPATAEAEVELRIIDNMDRLQRIFERSLEATSWADLLATE
jgi:hypothetical protein